MPIDDPVYIKIDENTFSKTIEIETIEVKTLDFLLIQRQAVQDQLDALDAEIEIVKALGVKERGAIGGRL